MKIYRANDDIEIDFKIQEKKSAIGTKWLKAAIRFVSHDKRFHKHDEKSMLLLFMIGLIFNEVNCTLREYQNTPMMFIVKLPKIYSSNNNTLHPIQFSNVSIANTSSSRYLNTNTYNIGIDTLYQTIIDDLSGIFVANVN